MFVLLVRRSMSEALMLQAFRLDHLSCEQWPHMRMHCYAWKQCIDFGGDRRMGRGSLGGKFAASYCNQWGLLLHRCVKVRIAIELSFGMVSGVGPGIHVLDGGPRASRGRVCFWHGFRQNLNFHVNAIQWTKSRADHGDDRRSTRV